VSSVVVCGVVSWCVEVCMHEVCGSVPLRCESSVEVYEESNPWLCIVRLVWLVCEEARPSTASTS